VKHYFVRNFQLYRVGQQSKPLHLTVYIFKTSELICVIFGTLQHRFVLNTPVNSVLDKFITPLAPPGDKIKNSVFHLQNQLRPPHSNAHVFKIPGPICTCSKQVHSLREWRRRGSSQITLGLLVIIIVNSRPTAFPAQHLRPSVVSGPAVWNSLPDSVRDSAIDAHCQAFTYM